jgi:hypothetical protein
MYQPAKKPVRWHTWIAGLLLLILVVAATDRIGLSSMLSGQGLGCNIKGNISMRTGERIYHVPSGKFYNATVINPANGERWFCSETEARAAGWRKSRR